MKRLLLCISFIALFYGSSNAQIVLSFPQFTFQDKTYVPISSEEQIIGTYAITLNPAYDGDYWQALSDINEYSYDHGYSDFICFTSISLNTITVQILHNQSGTSREIVIFGASGGYIIVSQSFLLKPAIVDLKGNCLLKIK